MTTAKSGKTGLITILLLITLAWSNPASAREPGQVMLMPVKAKTAAVEHSLPEFTARVREYFGDNKQIVPVGDDQLESLLGNASGNNRQLLQVAGDKLGCASALVITLERHRERLGDEYSATDPASLAFEYQLLNVTDGSVICYGQFDETQQPVSENILAIGQAFKRGFKWITIADLTREALERKFSSCPGLTDSTN